MTAVIVFGILSVLLAIGQALRARFTFLQRLYLPSGIVGGLVGLAVFTALGDTVPKDWVVTMRQVPGFLISVIFATLFLGAETPRFRKVLSEAFPQLCLGQLLAWGQYVVGLGFCGFVLMPLFGVSPLFGNLLEIGFEGGHGTVGGMVESFKAFGWEDGIALGYTMATVGMVLGIVVGMALVNRAYAKGVVACVRPFESRSLHERVGVFARRSRPAAGRQTVCCDSVDSLGWHLAVTGLAVGIGYLMLVALRQGEVLLLPEAKTRLFEGFPLFPLCMIGGVLLQSVANRCRQKLLVDRGQMQRISGAALDFLVLAAVATIRLDVVLANWIPLTVLIVAGAVWNVTMVLGVGPRLFKDAWFERSIAEFGQASGVTATGLLLLRTVDPENRTSAAASFGYKQLLHEPFMGGGIWTALALTLVATCGWLPVWGFSVVMLAVWSVATVTVSRRNP